MKTFCSIIQQHIESRTNIFLPHDANDFNTQINNNKKNESNNFLVSLFHTYMTGIYYNTHQFTCKNKKFITICKFNELRKMLHNIFIPESQKEALLILFSKIQRTYYAFSRLANIFRYKKAVIQISSDLCMNDIKESDSNVFTVIHNKSKYLFIISDLINIMNNNLFNSVYFFPEPLQTKNPYNNIPFNASTMYNIYFFIRLHICIMPELIQGYYLSNLDLDIFKYNYEGLIRETYIKNYVYTTHFEDLHDIVLDMIKKYNIYGTKLAIHNDFPEDKLVTIMRPYLFLYYMSKYYISGSCKKQTSVNMLKKKFRSFIQYNPFFGRKRVCFVNKSKRTIITFNCNHINFNTDYNGTISDLMANYDPNIEAEFYDNESTNYDTETDSDDESTVIDDSDNNIVRLFNNLASQPLLVSDILDANAANDVDVDVDVDADVDYGDRDFDNDYDDDEEKENDDDDEEKEEEEEEEEKENDGIEEEEKN